MTDMYTDSQLIERRWKTRAKKIVITNPVEGQKQIVFDVEAIPYDNNVPKLEEAQTKRPLKINVEEVATNMFTIFDPVTGKNITISAAGIAMAIEAAFVDWTLNK